MPYLFCKLEGLCLADDEVGLDPLSGVPGAATLLPIIIAVVAALARLLHRGQECTVLHDS